MSFDELLKLVCADFDGGAGEGLGEFGEPKSDVLEVGRFLTVEFGEFAGMPLVGEVSEGDAVSGAPLSQTLEIVRRGIEGEELPDEVRLGGCDGLEVKLAVGDGPGLGAGGLDGVFFLGSGAVAPFAVAVLPGPSVVDFAAARIGPFVEGQGYAADFDTVDLGFWLGAHGLRVGSSGMACNNGLRRCGFSARSKEWISSHARI